MVIETIVIITVFVIIIIIRKVFVIRGLTDVSVMRLGPVGASSPPRMIESLLVLATLRRGSRGFRHRAAAAGLAARRSILRPSSIIVLLPRTLAIRLAAAFRLGHEDRQSPRYDRTVSRLWQVHHHAAGAHRRILVRHPENTSYDQKGGAVNSNFISSVLYNK